MESSVQCMYRKEKKKYRGTNNYLTESFLKDPETPAISSLASGRF